LDGLCGEKSIPEIEMEPIIVGKVRSSIGVLLPHTTYDDDSYRNLQFLHRESMSPRIHYTRKLISYKETIPWNRCLGFLKSLKIQALDTIPGRIRLPRASQEILFHFSHLCDLKGFSEPVILPVCRLYAIYSVH
jgi:hypothetical protein